MVLAILTFLPIGTQTSLAEYIGVEGCYVYTVAQLTFGAILIISGFGMAVFRFQCLKMRLMTKEERKVLMKKIIIGDVLAVVLLVAMGIFIVIHVGWERAIFYRYCMNMDPMLGNVLITYSGDLHDNDLTSFDKMLRATPLLFAQVFIIGEILIYAIIIRNLWKSDYEFVKSKTISDLQRRERNQKNLITLKGQISTFVIEMVMSTALLVFLTIYPNMSPSLLPILWILCGSLISIPQLISSHEMKRFLRDQFGL